MNNQWNPKAAYDKYFSSGAYDDRYPHCNPRTLHNLLKYAAKSQNILDFGCGDGRYAIPLLQHTDANVVGYDISNVALKHLGQKLRECEPNFQARTTLIEGDLQQLESQAPFDLIIAMFGVLSHITGFENRIHMLRCMANLLRSHGEGILILSVPNAWRRFFVEQAKYIWLRNCSNGLTDANEPGDIIYPRIFSEEITYEMYYHLYTVNSLKQELATSGFIIQSLVSESILPEFWVTHSKGLALSDRVLSTILPAQLGYGILAIAKTSPCDRHDRAHAKDTDYANVSH